VATEAKSSVLSFGRQLAATRKVVSFQLPESESAPSGVGSTPPIPPEKYGTAEIRKALVGVITLVALIAHAGSDMSNCSLKA
jgi:hypothetical protein